jgi:DNA-binding GntR family transcriptional regulator
MALSTIFVPAAFSDVEGQVADWDGAVQELIAERHGVRVSRIEQEIRAETLDAASAKILQAGRGDAALRTMRRYASVDGAVVLVSDSIHPAARFVYAMTYRRDG